MQQADTPNVVVVGAGLAGLAAAWQLEAQGFEVSIVERSDRAGGSIGGEWIDGFCMDQSLHLPHTGDVRLHRFIARLGLRDTLLPLRPVQLTQYRDGVNASIDPQSLMGVASIPGVSKRDGLRLVRWARLMNRYRPLLDVTAPERAASLDYRSAADFGRIYFGDSVFERWIAPEVSGAFVGDEFELSRVAVLLTWLARNTGQQRSVLHGLARRGLHELPAAAAEKLPIRYGVEVTRVDEAPSGGFSVECRGLSGGRGMLEADAVVIATSATEAGRIADPIASLAERDYLSQVRYAPSITLAVALARPLGGMPQLVRMPHVENLAAESILSEPGISDGRAPIGSGLVTLCASERFALASAAASDDVVEKGLLDSMERAFPGSIAAVRFTRLSRRAASIPRFEVGAYRAIDRFRRVQKDRRELSRQLYFAGDYLVGPSAEASVISGLRAAADFCEDVRTIE